MTSTWKHPRTGQQVLIQDKHGLFADLANKELSGSSKKFRFTSKPCKDVKFKLSTSKCCALERTRRFVHMLKSSFVVRVGGVDVDSESEK
jgi:hypothetical protein